MPSRYPHHPSFPSCWLMGIILNRTTTVCQSPCYFISMKSMWSLFNPHLDWVLASQGRWFQGLLSRRAPEDTSSHRSCSACQKTAASSANQFMTEWIESICILLRFKQMLPPLEHLKMQIYSWCQTFICNRAVMSAYLRKLPENRCLCQAPWDQLL